MKPWTLPLRTWQQKAVDVVHGCVPDCLVMATPAAGKTTLALKVVHDLLAWGKVQRVVIVCPTDHLRTQWTRAAAAVGIQLDPDLQGGRGVETRDYVGAVVTYQQVAGSPPAFAAASLRRRTVVVFDEIHHAADGKEWGKGLREAFGGACARLALSGTPFRSDDAPIPFIRYADGISQPDFSYGYADAIRDGVSRPMYFPSYEGELTWRTNGRTHSARFDDLLDEVGRRQRLKTALVREEWLGLVIREAHEKLVGIRDTHPQAGGLIVAMNQAHAREVATLVGRLTGCAVPVAISDAPESSATITRFAASRERWLVAVNMVSEGVDIPRLRVGVYATNVSTELYFRQVVGRFVRMRAELGRPQQAWLYLPKDPMLVEYAEAIQAERNHALAERPEEEERSDGWEARRRRTSFEAISGTARAAQVIDAGYGTAPTQTGLCDEAPVSLAERKEQLRETHKALVGHVFRCTGTSHREINLELIKRVGGRIESATLAQLERRIRLLTSWRDRGIV